MTEIAQHITQTLVDILPDQKNFPLHEPFFEGNEKKYMLDCIDSRFVSSVGKYVDQFEEMLADFTGAKYAVAVVNGTSALHIALILAGVGPESEVLVPSLTFVGTANAVTYCNATPHFIDSHPETLCVDIKKLDQYLTKNTKKINGSCINKNTGKKIQAIIPVHVFGHPVDMDPLSALGKQYGINIVEDAAESLGSYYKGNHTGTFGIASAISFNGNKAITTGGGGAVLCNDKKLARLAKHLTTTAKADNGWHHFHDQAGFNYRMPNINAALGCAQLEQLPEILIQKRHLAQAYKKAFGKRKDVHFFDEPEYAKSNFWLNTLRLKTTDQNTLEKVLEHTNRRGIFTRPIWTPLHQLPMYTENPTMDLSGVTTIKYQIFNIPSSKNLTLNQEETRLKK